MSRRTRIILLLLFVLAFVGYLVVGYTAEPASKMDNILGVRERSVWDWIAIGLVGAAVAYVGWLFVQRQKEYERIVTSEHEQDAAITAYLEQMSNLMIDQQLGKDREDNLQEHVRKVAQARTIAVLLGLDSEHKIRPLKLVHQLGLLDKPDPQRNKPGPVLDLTNAGLDGANLSELTLPKACLNGADLRRTDLHGADLQDCNLSLADLRGANLSRADLSRVDLRDANLLPYDKNNSATWNKHNLEKRSTLSNGASFSRRGLKVTNLSGATLHNAKLGDAWLGGANLRDADLRDADLSNADLTGAKGWTEEQLSAAKSLAGATMPNGKKYEDWL
jgi:uncharacterized protein YjbI with pentapeptide repeats